MKQITLQVEDNKYQFFLELVKSLDFVQVENLEYDTKPEIIHSVQEGFNEVAQYKAGLKDLKDAQSIINEL